MRRDQLQQPALPPNVGAIVSWLTRPARSCLPPLRAPLPALAFSLGASPCSCGRPMAPPFHLYLLPALCTTLPPRAGRNVPYLHLMPLCLPVAVFAPLSSQTFLPPFCKPTTPAAGCGEAQKSGEGEGAGISGHLGPGATCSGAAQGRSRLVPPSCALPALLLLLSSSTVGDKCSMPHGSVLRSRAAPLPSPSQSCLSPPLLTSFLLLDKRTTF